MSILLDEKRNSMVRLTLRYSLYISLYLGASFLGILIILATKTYNTIPFFIVVIFIIIAGLGTLSPLAMAVWVFHDVKRLNTKEMYMGLPLFWCIVSFLFFPFGLGAYFAHKKRSSLSENVVNVHMKEKRRV